MPMVTNAQNRAATTDANWLREERVMLKSFFAFWP